MQSKTSRGVLWTLKKTELISHGSAKMHMNEAINGRVRG
jgi:hypothetical protein